MIASLVLASCQGALDSMFPKEEKPIPAKLMRKIKDKGMTKSSPILLRIYKTENVLEVWKAKPSGQYAFLTDYEICKWSGKLGPKFKEGDKQAPEGFYSVRPAQMNPRSSYHLSFNMGFPNTFDRAHGRTGSHLMVHGACSSAGCYSMTDEYVEEIYALARESFEGGQKAFQIQAYPFKMTPENLAKHVDSPHFDFWKRLKEGSDHFEVTKRPPKVDVCNRNYVFNQIPDEGSTFHPSKACPEAETPTTLALAYTKKAVDDQDVFVKILSKNAASPFLSANVRNAAKKQAEIEKANKEKLRRQQAMLVQKQQQEVIERQRAAAIAKAEQEAAEAAKKKAEEEEAARKALEESATEQTEVPAAPPVAQEPVEPLASTQAPVNRPIDAGSDLPGVEIASPTLQIAEPVQPPVIQQPAAVEPAKPVKPVKRKRQPVEEIDR